MNDQRKDYIIGFAGTYYTLWNIDVVPSYNHNGECIGHHLNYAYIKNISTDVDKVKSLYPSLNIDLSLSGKRSFSLFQPIIESFPDDVFGFGKYKGQSIASCTDIEYVYWAFEAGYFTDANKIYAERILTKAGYYVIEGFVYSPENYKTRMENLSFTEIINAGKPFDVLFESSLNSEGQYVFRDKILNFKDFQSMYYNGYEYGLPIINGKAKRIKGKTYRISSYIVTADGIDVQSMEMVKV